MSAGGGEPPVAANPVPIGVHAVLGSRYVVGWLTEHGLLGRRAFGFDALEIEVVLLQHRSDLRSDCARHYGMRTANSRRGLLDRGLHEDEVLVPVLLDRDRDRRRRAGRARAPPSGERCCSTALSNSSPDAVCRFPPPHPVATADTRASAAAANTSHGLHRSAPPCHACSSSSRRRRVRHTWPCAGESPSARFTLDTIALRGYATHVEGWVAPVCLIGCVACRCTDVRAGGVVATAVAVARRRAR